MANQIPFILYLLCCTGKSQTPQPRPNLQKRHLLETLVHYNPCQHLPGWGPSPALVRVPLQPRSSL